ncbi:bifunctional Delta(1)-pyrroline-2-carboxylate/Delta(1)-piperideine-2-carboxylate reductase [Pseudomonas chlororaphis]|uniref:bifunctional Delta(1)-pyrroline-2-carboxylate/Delta(1)-piperideine-2- carboxylate reductase n=1 Tax=Pseudomonas chlororaphis TaxID=587753 RepID=UPI0030D13398
MTSAQTPASKDRSVSFDRLHTAAALGFEAVAGAVKEAALQYEQGEIYSPERMVVRLAAEGVMLSMPASAPDIAIHKLVNVHPSNRRCGLPTIHGQVSVFDSETGRPLCVLDGPEVTGRRTAAVSLLGIQTFLAEPPKSVLLVGTGTQAQYHLQALSEVYPKAQIWVRGISRRDADDFCVRQAALHGYLFACEPNEVPEVDVVITLTTSTVAFYDEPALVGRLVIGVGAFKPEMAEIGKGTLLGSQIYIDDLAGGQHEAGDLIQAGVDWSGVRSLASALREKPDLSKPIVLKSVGTAAWDLAACRVACKALSL